MPPTLIPVLDVMGGAVVRAVGGRRDEYRPVDSPFGDAADPVGMMKRLRQATGSKEVYVADLDAIRGDGRLSPAVVRIARANRGRTWIDAGFRRFLDVEPLAALPRACPVIASEAAWSQRTLSVTCEWADARPVAFSIDLLGGVIIGNRRGWGFERPDDVLGLAAAAVGCGAAVVIVLDLTAVGGRDGPVTGPWCRALRAAFPRLRILTGGGVRHRDDVARLGDAGADGVLVASALHDRALP